MMERKEAAKRLAAVTSAYTGIAIGNWDDTHEYIEEVLGRPVFTHELASKELWAEIHEKSKPEFLSLWKAFLS